MREFVDNVARVNGLAEQIDGFVWRLQDDSGNAMSMRVYDDPAILPNLTVWENVERSSVSSGRPCTAVSTRGARNGSMPIETPLVLWCIPAGHRPAMAEGVARLEHLRAHGPSDYAFGWDDIPEARIWKTARGATTQRARGMTKIIIDGNEIDVPPEYTLLQACEAAGAEIPRFCFHERLSIAGNCRMCLVEVKGSPKPQSPPAPWACAICRPARTASRR